MHPTPWLQRKTAGTPRARLFCFPYAGGGSSVYAQWQAGLDPAIEVCAVQLPGRGARMAEAPCSSMSDLIDGLLGALRGNDDLPFVFFGHSLGALVAFELARHCQWHGLPKPAHLIVSGSSAPQARAASRNLHAMDDELLFKELEVYNGTPPEILQNRELMSIVLPTIRADFALAEQYVYRNGLLLEVPLTVLAGRSDVHVSPAQVADWQKETAGTFHEHWFDGDHFFLAPRQKDILECIGNLFRKAHA